MLEQNSEDGPESGDGSLPLFIQQSICSRCVSKRVIRSGKGSVFLLCQLGIADPSWPKYPPQPIRSCPKFCAE